MSWQRFNTTSNVFEVSENNGASWTPLVIAAGGITLPAGLAYANAGNNFVIEQDFTGGSGTAYYNAPIEIRMSPNPRVSFHWPGVVASQIGMDSAGTICAFDNPGTGYAAFACANINCAYVYSTGVSNNLGDLTCRGATNFQGGLNVTGGTIYVPYNTWIYSQESWQRLHFTYGGPSYLKGAGITFRNSADGDCGYFDNANNLTVNGNFTAVGTIGCSTNQWRSNIHNSGGYMYPGNISGSGSLQASWYIAGHSTYGMYTNSGLYIESYVYPLAVEARAHIRAAGGLYDYGRASPIGTWTAMSPVFYTAEGAPIGGTIQASYCVMGKVLYWFIYNINFSIPTATSYIRCTLPAATSSLYCSTAVRNYIPGIGDRMGFTSFSPDANWLGFHRGDGTVNWPTGTGHMIGSGFYPIA